VLASTVVPGSAGVIRSMLKAHKTGDFTPVLHKLTDLAQQGQGDVPNALIYAMVTLVNDTDKEAVLQQLHSSSDLQAVTAVKHLQQGCITVVDIGESLRGPDRIRDYKELIKKTPLHEAFSKVSSNCIMCTRACARACSADYMVQH
jgi:hypothetical protein